MKAWIRMGACGWFVVGANGEWLYNMKPADREVDLDVDHRTDPADLLGKPVGLDEEGSPGSAYLLEG